MNDIQTAYEATSKVLSMHANGRYYDRAVKKSIPKTRAEEIALSNGIALDDYNVLFKLTKFTKQELKSDQYTVIVALEAIVPAFYIDSEQNGDGKIVAVNSAGDKLTMTDNELVISARGMEFVVKLDIDEGVYIDELNKSDGDTLTITGNSGTTYTFNTATYELIKSVGNEEVASKEIATETNRLSVKDYIFNRRHNRE